jgi:GTP-binding protein
MFVDRVEVTIQAGNGGDGAVSFRHEKFIDRGGPDGGDGGNGGNVVLVASRNQNTLASFRYQKLLKAENGQPGGKRRRHGKNGQSLIVPVPVGTVATSEDGRVLADLVEDGQRAIIARGGGGGFGNAHFVSSTRQAPRVAEKGERGEALPAVFELKMIADVGIVGLPNAGKSTFLSVVSNARPAIANYPFTTLTPNLGVVDIDGEHSLLIADIPGLIEGASQGKGLGDEFLRHAERTSVILHLIDIYSEDISADYLTIMKELAAYKVDLSKRPQVVVLSKIEGLDKKEVEAKLKQLKETVPRGVSTAAISSVSGEGVQGLLRVLQKHVSKERQSKIKKESIKSKLPVIGVRDDNDAWRVTRTDEGYRVTGQKIERFARRTRFGDGPSEERLHDIMRKMGILRELKRQAAEPGQSIIVGQPEIGRIEY